MSADNYYKPDRHKNMIHDIIELSQYCFLKDNTKHNKKMRNFNTLIALGAWAVI